MTARLVIISAFLMLCAWTAIAATDVAGNWAVTITTADGKITGKASLKLTGDRVTAHRAQRGCHDSDRRGSHRGQADSEDETAARPDGRIRELRADRRRREVGRNHPGRGRRQGNDRIRADQAIGRALSWLCVEKPRSAAHRALAGLGASTSHAANAAAFCSARHEPSISPPSAASVTRSSCSGRFRIPDAAS